MSTLHPLFKSFIQAGFECSTQKLRNGARLDLIASTQHDRFVKRDFARLAAFGIRTIRTAARWHLIAAAKSKYNFESLGCILDAAEEAGLEVLLDILHFGWPDHIQIFSPSFVSEFGRFTHALAQYLRARDSSCRYITPVNEISYLAWAGGQDGHIHPNAYGRGHELKCNLIRAAVLSSEILLNELPRVRLVAPEPVIYILGDPDVPGDVEEAHNYTMSQYQAWDMLSGRMEPGLGGKPEYLDIIGINFYAHNQWFHNGGRLVRKDPRYKPFRSMLHEVWERYRRPMFVAETGAEDGERRGFFEYVCDEVDAAMDGGVPIHGICLYPIINHPGWIDDRHCHNGLWDYADASGNRAIYRPLADSIVHQQERFTRRLYKANDSDRYRPDLFVPSEMGIRVPAASTLDEPIRAHT